MAQLNSAKMLGGFGTILMLLGGIITFLLPILGFVLVLIAVKYISDDTKDPGIFKNYVISFAFGIIALIIAGTVLLAGLFASIGSVISDNEEMALKSFLGTIIGALLAFWFFIIISAIFLRKSYISISEKTNVNLFKTTGTVWLIGAILVIAIIGLAVILIAMVLQMVAFFSLPDKIETQVTFQA
ncbi:MAG: DUF996 domain-containing protein [Archaeoglobaceae archaeon]|nr:DUF996 domain-containing protein [Archaeoglobaceae archaeon]MDW8117717.1 DUF996 domain-containing protein [Archaeoglobaceae archaeon]